MYKRVNSVLHAIDGQHHHTSTSTNNLHFSYIGAAAKYCAACFFSKENEALAPDQNNHVRTNYQAV